MPSIVEYPTLVQQALQTFGDLFANEPQRQHFAEYLTGLMIAERKTVSGINREFVAPTDQSCLNRWLTEVDWDVQALNDRRLEWLQRDPRTRYSNRGVIALDNTLIDHAGQLIQDVGWLWDHANERYVIAHDYVISNYVCPSGAHYPIEWRRFRKREACAEGTFQDHTKLCIQLIDDALARGIPGDFTFDSYFSSAEVLNHLHARQRTYVADLKLNRKVLWRGSEIKLNALAQQIPPEAKKPLRVGEKTYFYFTKCVRFPDIKHAVRIVLFWKQRHDTEACKAVGTNHLTWEPTRIVLVYRHRWTGTETFHRDAKQQLGLGDCQVRSGEGQTRHFYLVSVAYSLLMRSLHRKCPQSWARVKLTTIGQACRAIKAETLGQVIEWVAEKLRDERWTLPQIKAALDVP
jgi:hypothetical protein